MGCKDKTEQDASAQGRLIRELIARFASDHLIGKKIKNGEFRKNLTEPPWMVPGGFTKKEIQMEKFKMEWLTAGGGSPDRALLQLHGGGYVASMRNAYRNFAVCYSELGRKMPVLTIDYRVAPENPYPAALLDAVSVPLAFGRGLSCKPDCRGGRFCGRRPRPCARTVFKRPGRKASGRDYRHVSMDGSDCFRGILPDELRKRSPVWKNKGQPDLQQGVCGTGRSEESLYFSCIWGFLRISAYADTGRIL